MPGLSDVISPKRIVTDPPPPKKRSWRGWRLKSPFRKKHTPECAQHAGEADSGSLLNLPGATQYAEHNVRHCTTPSRAVSDAGHKFHNASPCQNSHVTERLGLSPRPILKSKSLGTKTGLGLTSRQGEEIYFGYDPYEALQQRKMRVGQPFEKMHYRSPLLKGEKLFQLPVKPSRPAFHEDDCCSDYEDYSDHSHEDLTIRPRITKKETGPYSFPRSATEASGHRGLGMIRSPELVQIPRSDTQEFLAQLFDKPDDINSVTFQRYSDLVRKQGRYSGEAGKKHLGTSDYESTPTPVSRVTRSPRESDDVSFSGSSHHQRYVSDEYHTMQEFLATGPDDFDVSIFKSPTREMFATPSRHPKLQESDSFVPQVHSPEEIAMHAQMRAILQSPTPPYGGNLNRPPGNANIKSPTPASNIPPEPARSSTRARFMNAVQKSGNLSPYGYYSRKVVPVVGEPGPAIQTPRSPSKAQVRFTDSTTALTATNRERKKSFGRKFINVVDTVRFSPQVKRNVSPLVGSPKTPKAPRASATPGNTGSRKSSGHRRAASDSYNLPHEIDEMKRGVSMENMRSVSADTRGVKGKHDGKQQVPMWRSQTGAHPAGNVAARMLHTPGWY
ncbi:hypothetical protein BZA77DRAFT_357084 [Pyronema omphalodes]|nr:hypothetical protein BZA77DRAFT_357084 [Pyronema omphalodes]